MAAPSVGGDRGERRSGIALQYTALLLRHASSHARLGIAVGDGKAV